MKVKLIHITITIFSLCVLGPPQLRSRSDGYNTEELANQLAFQSGFNFDANNIFRLTIWVVAAIIALYHLSKNYKTYFKIINIRPIIWYYLFGLLALLSSIYSPSFSYTIYYSSQILILLILSISISRQRNVQTLITVLFAAFIIQWILIAIIYFIDPYLVGRADRNLGYRLVGGLFEDYGTSALISNIYFLTYIMYWKNNNIKYKLFCFLYLASWVFLLLSFTRSVIIVALIALFVNIFIHLKGKRKILFAFIFIASIILFFALGLHLPIIDSLSRGQSIEQLKRLSERTLLFSFLFEQWLKSPLIGFGYGAGARWLLADIVRGGLPLGSAHNAFIKVIVELGIIGFIVIIISLTDTWRKVLIMVKSTYINTNYNYISIQLLCLLLMVTITSIFGDGFGGGSSIYIVIVVAVGILNFRNKYHLKSLRKNSNLDYKLVNRK